MTRNELPLRDYQRIALDKIYDAWHIGTMRPAVVLPTGAGKTVIFAHLCREFAESRPAGKSRILILVHRDELVLQTVEKIRSVSDLHVGVVKAAQNEIDAQVIVGSVQTLRKPARLALIGARDLVIVDEAHHAAADSYVSVLTGLGCMDNRTYAVGFTATMVRETAGKSGTELADVWNEIVYQLDILDMIPDWLVDVEGRAVTIDGMTLAQVKMTRGDFSETSLSDMLLSHEAQKITADAYHEHARNEDGTYRKGVLFAPTVRCAQAFAEALNEKGIKAVTVHAGTPDEERRLIIKRFRAGEFDVLSNCGIFTEGTDIPELSVCVIARPTKNPGLYVQMVGRVLRPFPGKGRALVLDVIGASEDHSLATLADLSSRRVDKVEPGESLTGAARRLAKSGHPALIGYVGRRDVDLFHKSTSMWNQTEAGVWFIATQDKILALWPSSTGDYHVGWWTMYEPRNGEVPGGWIKKDVGLTVGMSWAEKAANELDEGFLTNRRASWRKRNEPASPAQIRFARRLGLSITDDVRKGDLSTMITIRVASMRLDSKLPKVSA